MPANMESPSAATGLEKVSFHLIPKNGNAKECSNYCTIALISHASKCSKFSKPGFNSTWNMKFQMFDLDLEKAEEPEIKLPTSTGSLEKRIPEKHVLLPYWLCQSLWLCRSQQTVENSSRDGNTRLPDLPLDKSVCRSRRKLEADREQQTGSKLGRSTSRLYIVTLII